MTLLASLICTVRFTPPYTYLNLPLFASSCFWITAGTNPHFTPCVSSDSEDKSSEVGQWNLYCLQSCFLRLSHFLLYSATCFSAKALASGLYFPWLPCVKKLLMSEYETSN